MKKTNDFITKLTVKVENNHKIFLPCYKLEFHNFFVSCTIQYTVRWWAYVMRESVVASSVSPGDVGGAPDSLDALPEI